MPEDETVNFDLEKSCSVTSVRLDDAGCWPDFISDATRLEIVGNGSSSVQHLEVNFAEHTREGRLVKGENRNLTRE